MKHKNHSQQKLNINFHPRDDFGLRTPMDIEY